MKYNEFEVELSNNKNIVSKETKIFKNLGIIKLFHVIFVISMIFMIFTQRLNTILLITSIIISFLLIYFWFNQTKVKKNIDHAKALTNVYEKQLDRISGAWVGFSDVGLEFSNPDHPYASDLDIIGKQSVFQFLNTTATRFGREQFARDLLFPNYTESEIYSRQIAIKELSEDLIFAANMQVHFQKIGQHAGSKFLIKFLKESKSFIQNQKFENILTYGPLANIFIVGIIMLLRLHFLYPLALISIIVQLFIWVIYIFKTQKYLSDIDTISYNLKEYATVLKMLEERNFDSPLLTNLQKKLSLQNLNDYITASSSIRDLSKIANRASIRRHLIPWMFLNSLFLFDIITAINYNRWRKKYGLHVETWFNVLGHFESLISFSNLPNVISITTLPTITKQRNVLGTEVGHPLITNKKRVNNDTNIKDAIHIISGSNMSGKTTYMRTVGLNMVLAKSGSFVCATEFSTYSADIITSMRIADNLNEGASTFFVELKRLKKIIDCAKINPETFFLIDEIFRGTNSVDRLSGAKSVLKKLEALDTLGMITTHDLEMCQLSKEIYRIKNFSFAEHYRDSEILFDYKLRDGVSLTTNAEFLMKMMEII